MVCACEEEQEEELYKKWTADSSKQTDKRKKKWHKGFFNFVSTYHRRQCSVANATHGPMMENAMLNQADSEPFTRGSACICQGMVTTTKHTPMDRNSVSGTKGRWSVQTRTTENRRGGGGG